MPEPGVRTFAVFLSPARAGMPDAPTPEEAEAVAAHFEYYRGLLRDGVLVLAGRTTEPPHAGVMVFEAAGDAEAERIARADPGVAAGVFEIRVQGFRVALMRGA
ncbi:MAG: YciI family protein [Phycisphaerales bacterium JB040]